VGVGQHLNVRGHGVRSCVGKEKCGGISLLIRSVPHPGRHVRFEVAHKLVIRPPMPYALVVCTVAAYKVCVREIECIW